MPSPLSACVLSSALALGGALPAGATPDASATTPASAPPLTETDARRLHKLAENWLALGQVPADAAAELTADRVVGVAVTLRRAGATLAKGEAVRADLGALLDGRAPAPADAAALLRKAAAEAFAKAQTKLGQLPLSEAAPLLCVEVQVGYAPAPVLLPAQTAGPATDESVFTQWAPGWHGLLLRPAAGPAGTPDRAPAVAWPGEQMADGLSCDAVLRRLLAAQSLEESALPRLSRPGGARLAVFEVFDINRLAHNLPPMSLVRGTVLTPESAINGASLRALSQRMALHLAAKVGERGTLKGGYRPALDQYIPEEAAPAEAALTAYALVREGARRKADDPADASGARCLTAAAALLKNLGPVVSDAKASPQPLAAALTLLALLEAPGGADRDLRDRLGADLMALDAGDAGYAVPVANPDPAAAQAKVVSETTASILTCALASWYERTRDAKAEALVARQLTRAFGHLEAARDAAPAAEAAYWLALAQRRAGLILAAAANDPQKAGEAHAARLALLTKQLAAAREAQILRPPAVGPADVVGGFAFGRAGAPLPTWRSAFVMGLWGQLLREEGAICAQNRAEHWLALGQGARFLAQLMATPASCYACRHPGAALGGVRSAPWETALDNQPTAMTLLALEEVIAATQGP